MCHIEEIEAKNFKHFDDIKVSGIGLFNLIVGDNNIGKTSLMELLTVKEDFLGTLRNWYKCLMFRGMDIGVTYTSVKKGKGPAKYVKQTPHVSWFLLIMQFQPMLSLKVWFKKPQLICYEFWLEDPRGLKVKIGKQQHEKLSEQPHEKLLKDLGYNSYDPYEDAIIDENQFYPLNWVGLDAKSDNVINHDFVSLTKGNHSKEVKFAENLSALLPGVLGFRSIAVSEDNILGVIMDLNADAQPLSVFGSGTARFMEILVELEKAKNCRMYIDEIDTGIHHSRLQEFLKTILRVAKNLNVQLFMTTHSKECEEAFAQVIQDIEMEKHFRLIRLLKNKENSVKASVHTAASFINGIETSYEFRNS